MRTEVSMASPRDKRQTFAWAFFGIVVLLFVAGLALGFLTTGHSSGGNWDGGDDIVVGLVTVLGFFAFPTVGILITSRRPDSVIGWICLAIGFSWAVTLFGESYGLYGLKVNPGSLPFAAMGVVLTDISWAPAILMTGVFLVLLFPDGRPPSPRWKSVLWIGGCAGAFIFLMGIVSPGDFADSGYPNLENPLAIQALKSLDPLFYIAVGLIPICFIASAVGLVLRYRGSHGTERLQLKWLVTAGVAVALLFTLAMLVGLGKGDDELSTLAVFFQNAAVASFALIPIAIGIAVLKHRLYDIDLVINKALVYGTVAVFITLAYVGIVVGIGRAVGSTRNLGLSIVATTIVAVAFQPVRERAQRFANRLVYGKRSNPYEVLSEFSGGMAQVVATEELLPRMARIVGEGTGAARSDVWLVVGEGLIPEASWPADTPSLEAEPSVAGSDIVAPAGTVAVPVRHQGEILGVICVTPPPGESLRPAESKLLDDLASQAGLVLRNVRLLEDIKVSRQRLVTAQDEERRRLERNLHDGAQQRLVASALALRMARGLVTEGSDTLGERIDQASDELSLALSELREFARGIHPAILTERGLDAAIRSIAERSQVPAVVESSLNGRLPDAVETAAYFAVSEALTNVAKYSQAAGVIITAAQGDGVLLVTVRDDGIGGADPARGSGLRGLADRVAVVDGTIAVHSPPGHGTRLEFRIPVPVTAEST